MPPSPSHHRLGGTQRYLRWPILAAVVIIISIELAVYALLRVLVLLWESIVAQFRNKRLRKLMSEAVDFESWAKYAQALDDVEGRSLWRNTAESPYYDYALVAQLLGKLRALRLGGEAARLARLLQIILSKRNIGGIDNEQLYNECYFGTKALVHDFVNEISAALRWLAEQPAIPLESRVAFFERGKRSYGRTALVLSGGAAQGYYHLGVIKSLFEKGALPKVISGTSAGSMVASLVCVRTDEELPGVLRPEVHCFFTACEEPFWVKFRRWWRHGYVFDSEAWRQKLQSSGLADYTFEEAYQRTGRILNISTTATSKYASPMILNHITAPRVVIWSAVLASCSLPHVIEPVELIEKDEETGELRPFHVHGKRWADGSIKNDIPLAELTETHNVNFFVVSQVNPHILPFVYDVRGSDGSPSPHTYGSRLRGGFISATLEHLLKLEMRKWLQLISSLDLLPPIFGQDWRYVFTQVSRGTVTIYPKPSLRDIFRVISDPSYADMQRYITLGERNTWPKLARIVNHFAIERTLRSCEAELRSHVPRPHLPPGAPTEDSRLRRPSPRRKASAADLPREGELPLESEEVPDLSPARRRQRSVRNNSI